MATVEQVREMIKSAKVSKCLIDLDTELPVLHRYASRLLPGQTYFETGTYNGCSAMIAALSSPPGVQVWTIDNADRINAALYVLHILKLCTRCGVHRDVRFFPLASEEMPWAGEAIDMLFIDGGHSLEAVNFDVTRWTPFVPSGGIVAFHDAVEGKGYRSVIDTVARLDDSGEWEREEGGGSIAVLRRT
jgi:predicted O-methyltransferase YrrM